MGVCRSQFNHISVIHAHAEIKKKWRKKRNERWMRQSKSKSDSNPPDLRQCVSYIVRSCCQLCHSPHEVEARCDGLYITRAPHYYYTHTQLFSQREQTWFDSESICKIFVIFQSEKFVDETKDCEEEKMIGLEKIICNCYDFFLFLTYQN